MGDRQQGEPLLLQPLRQEACGAGCLSAAMLKRFFRLHQRGSQAALSVGTQAGNDGPPFAILFMMIQPLQYLPVTGRLKLKHFGIAAAERHEVVMVSFLDDSPVFKHKNLVCHSNSGEAMGDQQRHLTAR